MMIRGGAAPNAIRMPFSRVRRASVKARQVRSRQKHRDDGDHGKDAREDAHVQCVRFGGLIARMRES